jgi:hypothetical protein
MIAMVIRVFDPDGVWPTMGRSGRGLEALMVRALLGLALMGDAVCNGAARRPQDAKQEDPP